MPARVPPPPPPRRTGLRSTMRRSHGATTRRPKSPGRTAAQVRVPPPPPPPPLGRAPAGVPKRPFLSQRAVWVSPASSPPPAAFSAHSLAHTPLPTFALPLLPLPFPALGRRSMLLLFCLLWRPVLGPEWRPDAQQLPLHPHRGRPVHDARLGVVRGCVAAWRGALFVLFISASVGGLPEGHAPSQQPRVQRPPSSPRFSPHARTPQQPLQASSTSSSRSCPCAAGPRAMGRGRSGRSPRRRRRR